MDSASAKSRDLIFKHPGIFINLKSRDPRIPLRPDDNDCGYQATTKLYLFGQRKIPGFNFHKSRDFHQLQIRGSRDSRDPAKGSLAVRKVQFF